MQSPLNKHIIRKYFIITIFLYLIIFNDLVLCKGGGGRKNRGGDDDGGTAPRDTTDNKVPTTSSFGSGGSRGSGSGSNWVFFYYGSGGQRYCGNLCIATAVIVSIILLLIIGCAIWKCYRIKKHYEDEEKKVEDSNDAYNIAPPENRDNIYNPYPPLPTNTTPATPPPTYSPPSNYFNNNLDGNYTNYTPGHSQLSPPLTENNDYSSQMKSNSRRESFDSMEEFKKNKKKKINIIS